MGLGTAGLGTAGLGTAGLGTAGLGTAGLGTAGLGTAGLGTAGLGTAGLGTAGLGTAGLGTAGLGTVHGNLASPQNGCTYSCTCAWCTAHKTFQLPLPLHSGLVVLFPLYVIPNYMPRDLALSATGMRHLVFKDSVCIGTA